MDSWDFLEFLGFLGNETPPKTAKRNNGFGVFWHFLTFFVLFWENPLSGHAVNLKLV
jgi:hypothetical protein